MLNTAFTQVKMYTFFYKDMSYILKTDPIGWEKSGKEYDRNTEYDGIITKFSNVLTFTKDSKNFLKDVYELDGVMGKVKLREEVINGITGLWEYSYEGDLDFETYEIQNNKIQIKFNTSGFEELLRSRINEEFEIDREKDLNDKILQPIIPNVVLDEGRNIFLKTDWETPVNSYSSLEARSATTSYRNSSCTIPLNVKNKSHEEAQNVTELITGSETVAGTEMQFFANSDRIKVLNISISLSYKIAAMQRFYSSNERFYVRLNKINSNGDIINTEVLLYSGDNDIVINAITNISYNSTITLQESEGLSLDFLIGASFNGGGSFRVLINELKCNLTVKEDSIMLPTNVNFLNVYTVLNRLSRIITGKENSFYSEYFGGTTDGYLKNGIGAFIGLAHGFWVRGFEKLPLTTEDDVNLFKPMTTSFSKVLSSCDAVLNIGMGIETIGRKQTIVIEDKKYFYNTEIITRLPHKLGNIKRRPSSKNLYSSVEVGYEQGDVFDEAVGLDEPNKKSKFITYLTKGNSYKKISSVIGSNYMREFCRRKPKKKYQTLSHKNDNDLFFLDLKYDGNKYKFRKYGDDFSEIPTGIYSPETATELRFSPVNILLRHGWFIASGLVKYMNQYLRYSSSDTNSNLKTKLRTDIFYQQDTSATVGDGNAYVENQDILNGRLKRPKFEAEYVEGECKVDYEFIKSLEGFTEINGRKIPNIYGLFEYINEENKIEQGFLINLKPEGKGKFLFLKHNR